MPATQSSPSAAEVHSLLHGLFGLNVTETDVAMEEPFVLAEYADETDVVVGYMACDLATGGRLGAALTQVPAGRVDEVVREKALPESLSENLFEVFNICVNLVAPLDGRRLVLRRICSVGDPDFDAVKSALDERQSTSFGFSLARYGECCLTISS